MLVNLNHTQALIVILVQNGLDAGGFAGTGVSEQQYIIGRKTFYKGLCIINQLFLLNFIAYQVLQKHLLCIVDRQEFHAVRHRLDAEGLIQTEHTYAVGFVKICNYFEDFIFIFCLLDLTAHRLYLFTDVFIVHPLFFADGLIVADGAEAVNLQIPLNGAKIKVKQVFEHLEICLCEMVDGTVIGSHLFAGHTEGILIGQENKGQIIVPQVLVKAVHGRQIQKRLHLLINPRGQLCRAAVILFIILENTGQLPEDAVFSQIPV